MIPWLHSWDSSPVLILIPQLMQGTLGPTIRRHHWLNEWINEWMKSWVSEYCYIYVAFCTIMAISRQKEAKSPTLFEWLQGLFIKHRHHCTLSIHKTSHLVISDVSTKPISCMFISTSPKTLCGVSSSSDIQHLRNRLNIIYQCTKRLNPKWNNYALVAREWSGWIRQICQAENANKQCGSCLETTLSHVMLTSGECWDSDRDADPALCRR